MLLNFNKQKQFRFFKLKMLHLFLFNPRILKKGIVNSLTGWIFIIHSSLMFERFANQRSGSGVDGKLRHAHLSIWIGKGMYMSITLYHHSFAFHFSSSSHIFNLVGAFCFISRRPYTPCAGTLKVKNFIVMSRRNRLLPLYSQYLVYQLM